MVFDKKAVFRCSKITNICISEFSLWNKETPYSYIFSEREFHEQSKYDEKIRIRAKGEEILMFKGVYFWSPQKSNIFTHKMLPPHPTSFLMPFLESSGNFLSENIYFCRGRVNIFKVMTTLILKGAQFSDLGGVTKKGRVQNAWPHV